MYCTINLCTPEALKVSTEAVASWLMESKQEGYQIAPFSLLYKYCTR